MKVARLGRLVIRHVLKATAAGSYCDLNELPRRGAAASRDRTYSSYARTWYVAATLHLFFMVWQNADAASNFIAEN